MEEKGAMAKIRAKYENHRQVCPDMGGKPLGFESCLMAFLALLGAIGICLILLFVELFSKWTKVNISWLSIYDRWDKILPDPLDKMYWLNALAQKDDKILSLIEENTSLKEYIAEYN